MEDEEELLRLLDCVDKRMAGEGFSVDYPSKRWAIREAIKRLTPTPPPPGSVEVRIAVAVGTGSQTGRIYVHAMGIDECHGKEEAERNMRRGWAIEPTHLAIVTAHIPRAATPVVAGRVES